MSSDRFIHVEISDYAPMNPNEMPSSRPVNGHFEIRVKRFEAKSADGPNQKLRALSAATVRLTNLASGQYPLFKNSGEVSAFQRTLILNDVRWSCTNTPGSDTLEFIYTGQPFTLEDNFMLVAYTGEFNSTAAFNKKAVVGVECLDFDEQFPDGFDDEYTLTTIQIYVPGILLFNCPELQATPAASGAPSDQAAPDKNMAEYSVAFGKEVDISWVIVGDRMESPTLKQDNDEAETVSPTETIRKKITFPTVFELSVKSKVIRYEDSAKVSFSISTHPAISKFIPNSFFCLPGSAVEFEFDTFAAQNCIISVKNSSEGKVDVSGLSGKIDVHPSPENPNNRVVTYTLTANGHTGKSPTSATMTQSIFVSRWTKESQKPTAIPAFDVYDGVLVPFVYLNKCYCFAGGALWESPNGKEWAKITTLTLPQDLTPCTSSFVFHEGYVYILNGLKENKLYLTKYNLMKNEWLPEVKFCLNPVCPGGSFVFINPNLYYYFEGKEEFVSIYNYSPDPFDCWAVVGRIKVSVDVVSLDGRFFNKRIYLAVACNDGYIRVYNMNEYLDDVDEPKCIKGNSRWVRLLMFNGSLSITCEAGVFHVDSVAQTDMMFDVVPKLLSDGWGRTRGIDGEGNVWNMEF